MKRQLGWLSYLLTLAFAVGLALTLVAFAWLGLDKDKAGVGTIGFGVPLVMSALVAGGLSSGERGLRAVLGWSGALVGFACGVALLICVASMVASDQRYNSSSPQVLASVGFGILMVLCGGAGIGWLTSRGGAGGSQNS